MTFTPQSASVDAGTGLDVAVIPGSGDQKVQVLAPVEAKDGAPAALTHDATEDYDTGQHGLILLGKRQDTVAPIAANGKLQPLQVNDRGEVKVSQPVYPAEPSAGTRGPVCVNATSSGTTEIIAAPGSGVSIYVISAVLSNAGSSKIRAGLRAGTGGTDRLRAMLAADGGGAREQWTPAWKLPANTALVVNLGAAGDVEVSVHFYTAA
jgi:hypothetical protein